MNARFQRSCRSTSANPVSRDSGLCGALPHNPATSMTSRQYYLTDHVRACACSGLVILMDVRSNRYLSVSGQLAYCLALLVRDWPMSPEGTLSNDDAHSVEDGLRDLL